MFSTHIFGAGIDGAPETGVGNSDGYRTAEQNNPMVSKKRSDFIKRATGSYGVIDLTGMPCKGASHLVAKRYTILEKGCIIHRYVVSSFGLRSYFITNCM